MNQSINPMALPSHIIHIIHHPHHDDHPRHHRAMTTTTITNTIRLPDSHRQHTVPLPREHPQARRGVDGGGNRNVDALFRVHPKLVLEHLGGVSSTSSNATSVKTCTINSTMHRLDKATAVFDKVSTRRLHASELKKILVSLFKGWSLFTNTKHLAITFSCGIRDTELVSKIAAKKSGKAGKALLVQINEERI